MVMMMMTVVYNHDEKTSLAGNMPNNNYSTSELYQNQQKTSLARQLNFARLLEHSLCPLRCAGESALHGNAILLNRCCTCQAIPLLPSVGDGWLMLRLMCQRHHCTSGDAMARSTAEDRSAAIHAAAKTFITCHEASVPFEAE